VVLSIARNDLALATERIVRANEADDGTNLHWHRLLAAHFFEAGRFIRRTSKIPEVRAFVGELPQTAQDDYAAVLRTAKRWSEKRLRRARNRTFHYVDIADPPRPQGKLRLLRRRRRSAGPADIQKALEATSALPAEIRGARRDGRTLTVDRFLFADQVAAYFAVGDLAGDETQLLTALQRIAEEESRLVQFANVAVAEFQRQRGFRIPTV
jgi:hypothetical protein